MQSASETACPPGEILRSAYLRRASPRAQRRLVAVPPRCIRNVGAPGKGVAPPVHSLRNGRISAIGYEVAAPPRFRRDAAARGAVRYGKPMMLWRLRWEAEWRRRAPASAQRRWAARLQADADWLAAQSARALRRRAQPLRRVGCPPGQQLRRAYSYTRRSPQRRRVHVPASCVRL